MCFFPGFLAPGLYLGLRCLETVKLVKKKPKNWIFFPSLFETSWELNVAWLQRVRIINLRNKYLVAFLEPGGPQRPNLENSKK